MSSFVEEVSSTIFDRLGPVVQELTVISVFLISYTVWRHFRRSSTSQRKVKFVDPSPTKPFRRRTSTSFSAASAKSAASAHSSCKDSGDRSWKLGEPRSRGASEADIQALERRILHHLEQFEFTRALALFRGQDRGGCCECPFSEFFYVTFIESAVRVGKADVVERLLNCMKRDSVVPSTISVRRMLKTLSSRKYFSSCLVAYSLFREQLPSDKVVWSCLVNAALQVEDFQCMPSMLGEYAKTDLVDEDHVLFFRAYHALADVGCAEALFRKLGSRASTLMLNLVLLTCVNTKQPSRGFELLMEGHKLEEEQNVSLVDTTSYNLLMKGLAQTGSLATCFECFRAMVARGLRPDNITCTTLLGVCIEEGNIEAIGEVIKLALDGEQQADTVMYTLIIKGLVKVNCLPKALEIYEEMKRGSRARPDIITHSVLIKALVNQHDLRRALVLVEDMKSAGLQPDDIIITHLLEGCLHEGNVALGERIYSESVASGVQPSEYMLVMLLKLYGRAGALQEAQNLVKGWEAAHGQKPTVIHYTCLMSGCLRRKQYDTAWAAYELMKAQGVRPDSTTLSTLLPGMLAAQNWDRVLTLSKEALAAVRPGYRIPSDTLNNALAQMQAADGQAARAAELQDIMRQVGVTIMPRRLSSGHLPPRNRSF